MKPAIATTVATILLFGCATPPEKEHQVVTEIISEPPGARIEVNGNYIGEAPVTTRIRHHPSDRVVMGKVVIRALPRSEGQYVQEKVFQGPEYPFDPHHDVVPERVFFDMKLKPASSGAPAAPSR
ncbi:MAG: PEGA domain-containing protein [Verrucomicrobiota bacterium]